MKVTLFYIILASVVFLPQITKAASSTVTIAGVPKAIVDNKSTDFDLDGLPDKLEVALGTDLFNQDSDGDGYLDGKEVYSGYNPLQGDKNRDAKRYVEVDLTKQRMYVYFNNIKIATIPVSTGKVKTPTPKGWFEVFKKKPIVHYIGPGYNLPNTKWNLEFKNHYYLHGAYWHNQFGVRPMSHGCVNIGYPNAEFLYSFMDVGDKVWVYGQTPAGKVKIAVVNEA